MLKLCVKFAWGCTFNKLKTTPTPNKNSSYGIKGGFVCHKSRSSYAIKVGLCTTFSVKVPLFQGFLRHTTPHFMAYFGVIFFANMGGAGGQNYFRTCTRFAQEHWGVELPRMCVHKFRAILRYNREKRVYTTTVAPLFSWSVARPRGHRAKKAMVYTIFWGKQGKRVYTTGPERRVYTIEPQTRKKKKGRVSTVLVYTIGNSRITFHHFILRELFLVIISSWLTSKYSGRIISRNMSDLHLLPHLLRLT